MENTEIAVKNKPEVLKGVTLTRDISLSIQNAILSGVRYYDRPNKLIRLTVIDEHGVPTEMVFPASTYDNWIYRGTIVPESNVTLKDMVEQTRAKYLEMKEKKQDEELKALSERSLKELLSLPIHNVSVMREMKRDKTGKMKETKRTTIKDISAPLVTAKVKGLTFALERLNPQKYGKKDEVKHAHVIFSLGDLRRHRDANKQSQQ